MVVTNIAVQKALRMGLYQMNIQEINFISNWMMCTVQNFSYSIYKKSHPLF